MQPRQNDFVRISKTGKVGIVRRLLLSGELWIEGPGKTFDTVFPVEVVIISENDYLKEAIKQQNG